MKIRIRNFEDKEFIGGRFPAEQIRELIEHNLHNEEIFILDFSGVSGITQSFADELVGILIRTHGLDLIKKKVKLENANETIRLIFNWVANYSKETFAKLNIS